MPKELVLMGIALLFGAWMVIDQRSLTEKLGLIMILFVVYVIFQYLGGATLQEIFNPFIEFFSGFIPQQQPSPELLE